MATSIGYFHQSNEAKHRTRKRRGTIRINGEKAKRDSLHSKGILLGGAQWFPRQLYNCHRQIKALTKRSQTLLVYCGLRSSRLCFRDLLLVHSLCFIGQFETVQQPSVSQYFTPHICKNRNLCGGCHFIYISHQRVSIRQIQSSERVYKFYSLL